MPKIGVIINTEEEEDEVIINTEEEEDEVIMNTEGEEDEVIINTEIGVIINTEKKEDKPKIGVISDALEAAYRDHALWSLRETHIKPLLGTLSSEILLVCICKQHLTLKKYNMFLPAHAILESFSRTLAGIKAPSSLSDQPYLLRSNTNFLSSILIHGEMSDPPSITPPPLFEPLIIVKGDEKYLHHPSPLWVDQAVLSLPLHPKMKERLSSDPKVLVYEWLLDLGQTCGYFKVPESFITGLLEDLGQCKYVIQHNGSSVTQHDIFQVLKPVVYHACEIINGQSNLDWAVALGILFKPFRILDMKGENGVFLYEIWRDFAWTGTTLKPLVNTKFSLISLLGEWDLFDYPDDLRYVIVYQLVYVISVEHICYLHKSWAEFIRNSFHFGVNAGGKYVRFCLELGIWQNSDVSLFHEAIQTLHEGSVANVRALLEFGCDPEELVKTYTGVTALCEVTRCFLNPETENKIREISKAVWCTLVGGGAGRLTCLKDLVEFHQNISTQFNNNPPPEFSIAFEQLASANAGFWWYMNRQKLFTNKDGKGYHPARTMHGRVGVSDTDCTLFSLNGKFDPKNKNRNKNDKSGVEGRRLVGFYTVEGAQFCLKKSPELPGVEIAVQQFIFSLFGRGTSTSELIQMEKSGYLFLVSQYINGHRLDKILDSPIMEKLHPQRTSELIISSILTNPEDGRPQNYIVAFDKHSELYYLVSVDNDHSLGSAVAQSVSVGFGSKQLIQAHCILFCLPQMDDPVHPNVVKRLTSLDIVDFLKSWLFELDKEYKFHQELMGSSSSAIKEFGKGGCFLGIPLTYRVLERLYEKYVTTVNILEKNSSTTHRQLLETHEPLVGHRYKVCAGLKSLKERFDQTDGRTISSSTAQGYINALDTPFRTMDEAHQALDEIKGKLSLKVDMSFRKLIEIKSIVSQQDYVSNMKFGDLKDENSMLNQLSNLPTLCEWKVLKLVGTKLLTHSVIENWPLGNLTFLDVSNSESLSGDGILLVAQNCPMLTVLRARNLRSLEGVRSRKVVFLMLTKLDLEKNPHLVTFIIQTPSLQKLYISYCPILRQIDIGTPPLRKLKNTDTPSFALPNLSPYQQLHMPEWLPTLFALDRYQVFLSTTGIKRVFDLGETLARKEEKKHFHIKKEVPPVFGRLLKTQIELALRYNIYLRSLEMRTSCLGHIVVEAIGNALKENISLTSLDMSSNRIDCDSISPLFEALKVNTNLTSLDFSKNPLKDATVGVFITSL